MIPTIILSIALLLCTYLLVMLWLIRRCHSSPAWRFIFLGLTILWAETAVGLHLVWGNQLGFEELVFICLLLAKSACYSIGFTIWRFDLIRLRERAQSGD